MRVQITQDSVSTKGNLVWYTNMIGQTLEVSELDADNYITMWAAEPYKEHLPIPKADTQVVE